jgi:chemotaxis protein methyltransferase CheR
MNFVDGVPLQDNDVDLLVNELAEMYGYDFSNYAKASLRRRISRLLIVDKIPSFAELVYRVKNDESYLTHVVEQLTVNVTEMFRDPFVFKSIREQVLPVLSTHPFIRIWHAGCSSGEEVYSMAIMLEEAGLLHKSLIYATDLNPSVVENIKKGIFPLNRMQQYSENYMAAGGKKDFSSFYTAQYGFAKFNQKLKQKMIAAVHNLVSDRSFNEFQVIFCRNVLIYFDKILQDKVLTLFDDSLEKLGFLILGSKENLRFSVIAPKFVQVNKEKIWRKMK